MKRVGTSVRALPRLPELAIVDSEPVEALLPSEAEGVVRSWVGNPGLELFGYEAADRNWIHVAGMATFRFRPGASRVDAFVEHGQSLAEIRDVYERSVLPLILQAMGVQVLHASAVLGGTGVIPFAGVSMSGKSTFAYALAQRGLGLWADDAVAFFMGGDAAGALPLPFSPRLRAAAVAQLDRSSPKRPTGEDEAVPIEAVVVLRPEKSSAEVVDFQRLRPADAFPALLPHAYCFSIEDAERNREMIDEYLRLVEKVPVWCMRFRPGLEHLPRILGELDVFIAESVRGR